MIEFEPDEINLKGFDNLVKAVGSKNPPYAKIGVLGKNVAREGKGASNAEIGAVHEYGSPTKGISSRSFLRMPLILEYPKKLENTDIFGEDELKKVLATGSLLPWIQKAAILAVATVKEAFFTSGWGRWAPWKNPNYENNTGQVLMDTKQLEGSITEEVVEQ